MRVFRSCSGSRVTWGWVLSGFDETGVSPVSDSLCTGLAFVCAKVDPVVETIAIVLQWCLPENLTQTGARLQNRTSYRYGGAK